MKSINCMYINVQRKQAFHFFLNIIALKVLMLNKRYKLITSDSSFMGILVLECSHNDPLIKLQMHAV